jgi:hypothetical protein
MIPIYNPVMLQFHGHVVVAVIESLLKDIPKSWFNPFVLGFVPPLILWHPSMTFNHLVRMVAQVHHLKRHFWWRVKLCLFLLPGIWRRKL